ncbi:hypothetical protein ACOMHN_047314 [Nucella lapillus]
MIESSNDQRSLSNESTIRFWKKTSESILTKHILWYPACQPSNHAEALCTVHERRKNRHFQKPGQTSINCSPWGNGSGRGERLADAARLTLSLTPRPV